MEPSCSIEDLLMFLAFELQDLVCIIVLALVGADGRFHDASQNFNVGLIKSPSVFLGHTVLYLNIEDPLACSRLGI